MFRRVSTPRRARHRVLLSLSFPLRMTTRWWPPRAKAVDAIRIVLLGHVFRVPLFDPPREIRVMDKPMLYYEYFAYSFRLPISKFARRIPDVNSAKFVPSREGCIFRMPRLTHRKIVSRLEMSTFALGDRNEIFAEILSHARDRAHVSRTNSPREFVSKLQHR